jgi:hypothetical protein
VSSGLDEDKGAVGFAPVPIVEERFVKGIATPDAAKGFDLEYVSVAANDDLIAAASVSGESVKNGFVGWYDWPLVHCSASIARQL